MKENDREEIILNSDMTLNKIRKSLIRSTVYSRSSSTQIDEKVPYPKKTNRSKRESLISFDRILNNKLKREEEQERIKMEVKAKKKLIKKVNQAIRKDYIIFFFLFLSSSLNFNYFFLPFIFIGGIYLSCIGNFKYRPMRLKYLLEIFVIGYASYLLLFKIIVFSLIKNENQNINKNHKALFIDLGNCILKDRDSNFYFFMNFIPEIIIILISGYGILVSFKSRLLTPKDLKIKNITNFKLSKYTFIIYVLMVAGTMFNLSYLSLFYIISIQIILFLCAIKFNENIIKIILKYMIYSIIILSSLQIIFVNCMNIPSINAKIIQKDDSNRPSDNYIISRKIGINITNGSEETEDIIINFIGYFFSILVLVILINTSSKINLEVKQQKNLEFIKENSGDEEVDKLVFKKSIFYKIINKIMKFLYHPVLNFEVSRILSIIWTYFYRNIFSFGILVFIFISFFSPHTKRNKYLVLYILSPMLVLSLGFFHVSNIQGYFEYMTNEEKVGYMSLGIKKYDYTYIEYPIGHLFFIIVMFLINSLYTHQEIIDIEIESIHLSEKHNSSFVEMQDLSKNDELKEIFIPKDKINEEIKIKPIKTVDEKSSGTNNNVEDNVRKSPLRKSNKINRIDTNSSTSDIKYKMNPNLRSSNSRSSRASNLTRVSLKIDINEITFVNLVKKIILTHIDKITLVVMYFVSLHTVNVIHVFLILIFIFQIISPVKINYFYKTNIFLFQSFYMVEFLIDLFKSTYHKQLNNYKELLEFFVVYNEDINDNNIEIFIYGIIYCFYFQYRTCNIESNKILLKNKKISLTELIKIKLKNHPTIQSILFTIGNILTHAYLWLLIYLFIFFNCYYEINFIFGIKLLIFVVCCLHFIFSFQSISRSYSDIKSFKILNRILLFFCCLNTLAVYLYQFLCKDLLSIKELIDKKRQEKNFFVLNLPNFGFTLYSHKDLYYNFIPHFLTTFMAVLYLSQSEYILDTMIHSQSQRRFTMSHLAKEKLKKKKIEQERMNQIRSELNEFFQDKMYADKYTENYNEIKSKSKQLFQIRFIILFTQFYWLGLFLSFGIIFNSHDMSFCMLLYFIIFGIFSMKMFHRIISKLTNYIKDRSYYISKVIRYSIVEKPKNRELNRIYRVNIFRCLIILSFTYFLLIYFYGIFDIYQHGCSPEMFKGCEPSFSTIFSSDEEDDLNHTSTEAKIKSVALLFGFYFNTRKEKILEVSFVHLLLTLLLVFDIYNQKADIHYSDLRETLQSEIQELVNENNVLQKYADIADLNILIKIGLAVEGIDLSADSGENQDSPYKKISLKDKFTKTKTIQLSASDDDLPLINLNNSLEKKLSSDDSESPNSNEDEKNEDNDDQPLQIDEPKGIILKNYDLNEKDESNSFLKNSYLKKFIDIIKKSNENEQELSVCNIRERVIQFLKRVNEQIIIFICLCLSLSKLNIWTFIYLSITIIIIFRKKTMYRFFVLYCFIFLGLIIQSIFFILNINTKSSIKTIDDSIYNVTSQALNIPIYRSQFNMTEEQGFFFGLGVSRYQVNNIILEFIQIILIYIYMNIFSYSIYQRILNLGEYSGSDYKFDLNSLNLEEGSIQMIKSTTEMEFLQYKECLECYDFNIGETLEDFFKLLKINKTEEENPFETKNKIRLNLKEIKNPVLKELIEYRSLIKDLKDNLDKKETKKYKPLPKYLILFQKVLYLYFHCFLLILMIMISLMTAGILSTIYFGSCFYYLLKSDSINLGQEYTYPKAIKKTLRIIVLIDITIQGIYQTPFFSMKDDDIRYKLLSALGFIKVVDVNDNEIDAKSKLEIYGKAIIYFFMSVQHYIYDS